MPIYTFNCPSCGCSFESIHNLKNRPSKLKCACGKFAKRQGIELVTIAKEGYQMKAIMSNGEHVTGHFGKEAKRSKTNG